MKCSTVLGHLRHLRKFKALRHFHTGNKNSQTWDYFQFLKIAKEGWNTPRSMVEQVNSKILAHSFTPEAPQPKFFDLPLAKAHKVAKNRLYSTCSDKPPKPPKKPSSCGPIDCTPKAKKPDCPPKPTATCAPKPPACPPKPDCPPKQPACPPKQPACPPKPDCPPKSSKKPDCPPTVIPEENKNCPDIRNQSSCSTNKPKCNQPPKSCPKTPAKPSGCAGGQTPPPCSRSFSSCAESTIIKKTNSSIGQQQRNKIQEFCSKKKSGDDKNVKNEQTNEKPRESFEERIKREKEEMMACLNKKNEFSGLSYTRIHSKNCVIDIISRDVRRFFREFDPYARIFKIKKSEKKTNDNERHWIELLLSQT